MYNQRPLFVNILLIIGFFLVVSIVLSLVLGIVGGLLWFVIKILLPIAVIVWLVRLIFGSHHTHHRY